MADKVEINPHKWIENHGDVMFRYTLVRVPNRETAEEIVQETFVRALESLDGFSGRSTERTWLMGILKHKIADYHRRHAKELTESELSPDTDGNSIKLDYFNQSDHWIRGPKKWTNPRAALEEKEFRSVLQSCMHKLPSNQLSAFTHRVIDQKSTQEVCKILGVSATNLGVLLYRARLQLRECLELNWFHRSKGK